MTYTTLFPMEWRCHRSKKIPDSSKNVAVRSKKPKNETIAQIATSAFTT